MPLRIPLTVDCNTPEERILANVVKNSRHIRKWVKTEPAHDRVAVLVGGGPSLADTVDEIKALEGQIFALNGAASFLDRNGVRADYQVIMDAQPATADLIGPAKNYLFASQVDPKCFRKKPQAILWHSSHGEVMPDRQKGFPKHGDDYAIIGGAVSVGNTALVLLYVLGYRKIHVFGMDSSHRDGTGHAYRQDMNDGDPCTTVEFGGHKYVCSITMSLQAKHFMRRAEQLKEAGVSIEVHGSGLLPAMYNSEKISEEDKYRQIWQQPDYRAVSPGEVSAGKFLDLVNPKGLVIDFGCGTGRGSLRISERCNVLLVDFVENSRDEAAQHLRFIRHDLTKPLHIRGDYGYCTDVMEHLPTEQVSLVVQNIMSAANKVYFQISTVPDSLGELIGQTLHLTVKPHAWWRKLFEGLGYHISWQEMEEHCSSFLVGRRP